MRTAMLVTALTCLLASCSASDRDAVPPSSTTLAVKATAYLGQEPPGLEPRLFAPGIVSTGANELSVVFSADGRELFLVVTGPRFRPRVILSTRLGEDGWSRLEEIPFFDPVRTDSYPYLSPDGSRLYFCSGRPRPVTGERPEHGEIWFTDRVGTGWGEPQHLAFGGGFAGVTTCPSVASNGNLYFNGSVGGEASDIFVSRYRNGRHEPPERLGSTVNSPEGDFHPTIASDESYLLFDSNRTEGGFGGNDLYLTFRGPDGEWTQASNLGEAVNTPSNEMRPFVTRDGKHLFFVSNRKTDPIFPTHPASATEIAAAVDRPGNGLQDIYWVSTEVLGSL